MSDSPQSEEPVMEPGGSNDNSLSPARAAMLESFRSRHEENSYDLRKEYAIQGF